MNGKRLGSIAFWTVLVALILVALPHEIIGPFIAVSPIIVVIASIRFYLAYLLPSDRSSILSSVRFALFIAGLLAAGYLAGSYGIERGIEYYCSHGGGNLCGLGGYFVAGPLAFSLAAIVYTFLWLAGVIAFKALKLPH
jgi:hypothetical protein